MLRNACPTGGKKWRPITKNYGFWRYSIECPSHLFPFPWVVGVDFTFYVYATIDFLLTELCFSRE